jgi:hypothetical protein
MKRNLTNGPLAAGVLVVAGSLALVAKPASACNWNDPSNLASVMYCRMVGNGSGVSAPSASDVAANILNRNAQRQQALDQGFRQLQDILQARAARGADPRVSSLGDKRLPPEQIGADLNPNAYYYPVKWDPAEATYGPSHGGGLDAWQAEEPVIDGSNIPSVIDFLDPMQSIPHVSQIGLDGQEIPSRIDFPQPQLGPEPATDADGIITNPELDLFKTVENRYRKTQLKTR